jgi:methanogenic corrinoid protein MtbC1
MHSFQHIAASLLDQSATALAGHAANMFLEEGSAESDPFGVDSFSDWRAHLSVRTRELAVAIELDAPELFATGVDWARVSFAARGVEADSLKRALACLQRVVEEELPPTAHAATRPCFEQALNRFDQTITADAPLRADDPTDRLALEFLETCLSGHPRRAMQHVLDAVDNGLDASTAVQDVISHALREVGRLWHSGKMGVHEEHLVTTTTMSLMTSLAQRQPPTQEVGKTVVGAAVGDNAHDLGVHMIMDSFTQSGWRSICLGGHLPAEDIVQAMVDFDADLLVLGATLITHLVTVREAIRRARELRPDIQVLVGGLAVQAAPDLWRKLGADAHALNAAEAIQVGRRLVGAA